MLPRFLASVRSRRRWALLLVVGVAAALAGRFFWAEFQLRAARRALERRAYPEAQAHLQRYLQVWPRSATAHLLGARCSRGAGNFDEAASLLAACRHVHADHDALIPEEYLLDAQRGTVGPVEDEALRHRLERGGPETPDILEAMALGCLYTRSEER